MRLNFHGAAQTVTASWPTGSGHGFERKTIRAFHERDLLSCEHAKVVSNLCSSRRPRRKEQLA